MVGQGEIPMEPVWSPEPGEDGAWGPGDEALVWPSAAPGHRREAPRGPRRSGGTCSHLEVTRSWSRAPQVCRPLPGETKRQGRGRRVFPAGPQARRVVCRPLRWKRPRARARAVREPEGRSERSAGLGSDSREGRGVGGPSSCTDEGYRWERVDPCWDPGVPGRPFCSWSRHREVETRGTEEEQPLRPAGRLPLGPASSFTHPAVPAGVGAIFTEGRIRTTAVRQVHIQAHGQTQPDSNPDLAPTFMFFLQKICQSRVHRAEENTRQNKSLFHPPSNKSEDDPKDTEFKNGVSVETRSGRDSA